MSRRLAMWPAALLILLGVPVGAQGVAHAKNCGGNKALPQPTPYTCTIPWRTIDGTRFKVLLVATGAVVTATITLDAPRPIPTPTVIRHHEGKSGDGGAQDSASGIIPPGGLSIRLQDSAPCRDGQADVKAVYIAPGDARGLIGGPWIENGTGCDTPVTPPTTPTPAAPPAVPPTIPAAPPGAPPGTPKRPTPPPANRPPPVPPGDRLPETGRDEGPALGAAVLMLAAGVALLILRGRKPIRGWRLARQR
jgi:LPXTG-motif cell wall-anchored protein